MTTPKELYRIDPTTGEISLDMHYYQGLAYTSQARFTFVIAGSQSGKTSFGPWWMVSKIYGNGKTPGMGGGDYIAATSTFDMFKLKMLPETRAIFETILKLGKYWPGDKVLELRDPDTGKFWARKPGDKMWGRIILRSANSPGALEAMTAKAAWLDECGQDTFGYDAWEAVLRRLALNEGCVLGTTTPYNLGWLKREVHDRWVNGDKDYKVIQFPSIANPSFPRREYLRAKRTLPDWRFKMFYQGLFARPAGMVYDCFDEATMTFQPFDIPGDEGRVGVGLDFGGANTAQLWAWLDPTTGIWYVFMESLSGGKSTQEHAAETRLKAQPYNRVEYIGGAFSETQYRMDWNKAGIPVQRPYTDDVEIGISAVIEMFKEGKLKISKELRGLLSELATYSRVLDAENQPTNAISNKSSYHRLDCLRYLIVTIARGGAWVRGRAK